MGDTFAALFAAQSADQQKGHREVHVGEMLEAVVVAIDRETIFVELDAKRQAMLDVVEMRSPDGTLDVKVGDTVRARVGSVDPNTGAVRLVRSFGKSGDIAQIEQAHATGVAVEGKVTGVNKGGIEVDLGRGLRGFCPTSQIATRGAAVEASSLIGQFLPFLVTEIKDGGRNIVLSRRRALGGEGREGRDAALRAGVERPPLSPYGATNPSEFFAVATEVFFDKPVELEHREPALFEVLRGYFNQDPVARTRRANRPA